MNHNSTTKAYLVDLNQRNHYEELPEIYLIGSDSACNARYTDIPPRMVRIEHHVDHYILFNLVPEFPIMVNNQVVTEARLFECDEVRIGSHKLKFTYRFGVFQTSFKLTSKNKLWAQELANLGHVAKTNFPVLLLGPSGTGKEVLAESLHQHSTRSHGPFVSVNCSALTETLIESELFGHVKGAFTGAMVDRKGAFETARGGTLFLDEIGDLPFSLQAKLLRALENNEIRPVGSDKIVKTDVRIISATHQNLTDKIQLKQFRADLYYRLNVVSVKSPSLIDRIEDFQDLIQEFSKKMRVRFSPDAIDQLKKHDWPGNIRELKNTVARASAFFPGVLIDASHIPKLIDIDLAKEQMQNSFNHSIRLPKIKALEKELIIQKLEQYQGNQRKAALELGIPKSTFHDKVRVYQINPAQYKRPKFYDLCLQEAADLMA
ncbi:MAG: hypothetical protein BroJett040_19820 [Oligoflexia bacterium]|nr:MAG: hypothetical protein BroJett040_19820 [Oligoflexia bacterium]